MRSPRPIARLVRRLGSPPPHQGDSDPWAPPAPPCPAGWDTGPPDFVGVGAQRSGTSWWFRAVAAHDAVARAPGSHKEVHYFDRFWAGGETDAAEYHAHFPRPPGSIVGEWTPRYMHDEWTPRLLRRLAADARILVMLRDPVERYLSGLLHEAGKGGTPSPLLVAADAFARGLYHQQLARLLAQFGAERVLVLQYEACLARPDAELRRTYAFLGLDPGPTLPADLAERVNQSPREKPHLGEERRAGLVDAYSADTARLLALYPTLDLELWPNMRHMTARRVDEDV